MNFPCFLIFAWHLKDVVTGSSIPDNLIECDIVGGGPTYPRLLAKEELSFAEARTFQGLSDLLQKGQRLIFIDQDVTITFPHGHSSSALYIPDNVTIFGDRGRDGSDGGRLYMAPTEEPNRVAILMGSNTRLTGLQIQGPGLGSAVGLEQGAEASGAEVDNCQLKDWPSAAISNRGLDRMNVNHNVILDNYRGITLRNSGSTNIYCNLFSNNWNSVAAFGQEGQSVRVWRNIEYNAHDSVAFAVHATNGSVPNEMEFYENILDVGGEEIGHREGIRVAARPKDGPARIEGNWFRSPLTFIDTNNVKQHAVVGRNESVPADDLLVGTNEFEMSPNYKAYAEGWCMASIGAAKFKMVCQAITA